MDSTNHDYDAFVALDSQHMVSDSSGIHLSFSIPPLQDTETSLNGKTSQDVETSQDAEPSQDVESSQDVKTSQDVETSQDAEPSQDVEPSQDTEPSQDVESSQPKLSKKVLARIAQRTAKASAKAVVYHVDDALSAYREKHPVVIEAPSGYKQEENGAYYKSTPDEMDANRIFSQARNLRADVKRILESDKASTDRYNQNAPESAQRPYVTKEGLRNCFAIPRERDPYLYLKKKMPVIFDLLVDPEPQTDIEQYMKMLEVMCQERDLVKKGKNKHLADATVEAHAHKIYNTKPANLR
jgi:hypothetical protein